MRRHAPDAWAGGSAGGGDAECGAGAGGGARGGGDADGAGAGQPAGEVDMVSVDAGGGAVVGGGGAAADGGAGAAGGGAAVSGGAGAVEAAPPLKLVKLGCPCRCFGCAADRGEGPCDQGRAFLRRLWDR